MILSPVESPCRITQVFGGNKSHYEKYGLKGHDGYDLTGPSPGVSVPIYAPYDGIVSVLTGKNGWTAYGNCVTVTTPPNGSGLRRQIVLGHLKTVSVKEAQWINAGDPVGMMGETGDATGIHVHMGLRYLWPDGSIKDFSNGYHGWTDFGPYLLLWKKGGDGMVLPT